MERWISGTDGVHCILMSRRARLFSVPAQLQHFCCTIIEELTYSMAALNYLWVEGIDGLMCSTSSILK